MKDSVTGKQLALPLVLACALSACGGGGSSTPPVLDTATRIAAAQQTATVNAKCVAVSPFYYEVGDKNGAIASGSIGGNTYVASSTMNIASASKWLFGAYVAEFRSGVLTASDTQATHMQSGYVSMGSDCNITSGMTVASCFAYSSNSTLTLASVGKFHYDSGHFQKWGVDNGMAAMTGADVASAYQTALGISVSFNGPLLAGGAITSAEGYAVFLRKILNGQLKIASLLGDQKTCTLPSSTCTTAEYSPIPMAWDYSIGHWVEDDGTGTGDGSFSSPGAFGFYPWIDSTKTYYGVLAREVSGGAVASYDCGSNIRKAFVTGVAQ